jgi:hypothetical protein
MTNSSETNFFKGDIKNQPKTKMKAEDLIKYQPNPTLPSK